MLPTALALLLLGSRCSLSSAAAAGASPIKHIVVLYEENRGFDHIFGHNRNLGKNGADVLVGNESVPK
jgi:phospholipase C